MMIGRIVRLRPLEVSDLSALARWRNAPDIFRWFSSPHMIAVSEQAAWYERYCADKTQRQWMIEELKDYEAIGTLALMHIDHHHQSAELGRVLIGDEARRSHGYAGEAVELLIRYAFEELNLQRLWLVVMADNTLGRQLYERCGFRHEGIARRAVWKTGAFRDLVMMARLRGEAEFG